MNPVTDQLFGKQLSKTRDYIGRYESPGPGQVFRAQPYWNRWLALHG